jgi:hypothetical protein
LGGIAMAGGLFAIWYSVSGGGLTFRETTALELGGSFFVLIGLYLILDTVKSKVILYHEKIEVHDLLPTRRLWRDEILGRRIIQGPHNSRTLLLIPRSASQKKIKLPLILQTDASFWSWMSTIPDLDAAELLQSETEIATDPRLGSTPEERLKQLARSRKIATTLTTVSIAVGTWGWMYPRPYYLAITALAVLPWITILLVARSGGLYTIDERVNDVRPNLALPFILPGFVLMIRALYDIQVLYWIQALTVAVVGAVLLVGAAVVAKDRLRTRPFLMAVRFVLVMAYGYGAGIEVDALLDRAAPETFNAVVTRKYVSTGRHTTREFVLSPWGPREEPNNVSVHPSFYEMIKSGDTVCVDLHSGAIAIPWYIVRPCSRFEVLLPRRDRRR